jgi:hypothetical protein
MPREGTIPETTTERKMERSKFKIKNLETFKSLDGGGYNGRLYYGKVFVTEFYDEGYGGGLAYGETNKDMFDAVDSWCKTLPNEPEFDLPMDIELFIGELVTEKEAEKDFRKGICVGADVYRMEVTKWKGATLSKMMKEYPETVRATVAELKANMPNGHRILNTNMDGFI